MPTVKSTDSIAFHEAGHAVAHILAGIPFKYVSIKPDENEDENGRKSLGHIMIENPKSEVEWGKLSIIRLLRETSGSGWATLTKPVPDSLRLKYINFILEHTC